LSKFSRYEDGCYGVLLFPLSPASKIDIIFKIRIFELLKVLFSCTKVSYLNESDITAGRLDGIDYWYFNLLYTYTEIFLEEIYKKDKKAVENYKQIKKENKDEKRMFSEQDLADVPLELRNRKIAILLKRIKAKEKTLDEYEKESKEEERQRLKKEKEKKKEEKKGGSLTKEEIKSIEKELEGEKERKIIEDIQKKKYINIKFKKIFITDEVEIKNIAELEDLDEYKDSLEFNLLEKIFDFILVLQNEYKFNSVQKSIQEEVEEEYIMKNGGSGEPFEEVKNKKTKKKVCCSGECCNCCTCCCECCYSLEDNEDADIPFKSALGKYFIYKYFQKRCLSIEFNYKLSKFLQKKLSEAKLGGDEKEKKEEEEEEEDKQDLRKIYFYTKFPLNSNPRLENAFYDDADRTNHRTKIIDMINYSNKFAFNHYFRMAFGSSDTWFYGLKRAFTISSMDWPNLFNCIFITAINIALIIFYYQSTSEDMDDYSENIIDRYSETDNWHYKIHLVFTLAELIVHIFLWIYYWVSFWDIYKVEQYESESQTGFLVPKLKKDTSKEKKQREVIHHTDFELIEKLSINENLNEVISKIFPQIKISTFYLVITFLFDFEFAFIFLNSIFNLVYFILLLAGYNFPVLLALPIVFILPQINRLKILMMAIIKKRIELGLVFLGNMLVLYAFMWISFQWFAELHTYEVVNMDNGEAYDGENEPFCYSSVQCMLTYLGPGFWDGVPSLSEQISYKEDPGRAIALFFFKIFAFLLMDAMLSNVFTSLITDAFSEQRDETDANVHDKEELCYICNLDSNGAAAEGIDFNKHRDEHSFMRYIAFIIYLFSKNSSDLSLYEKIIYDQIRENDISWVPNHENEKDDDD
ncbi:MAG: ion transporter, partial [archaeon]|nr:ion transporter [archaeon]